MDGSRSVHQVPGLTTHTVRTDLLINSEVVVETPQDGATLHSFVR